MKKRMSVKIITFCDLIIYGLKNSANIVDGMPWSFEIEGLPVSHENDKTYIVADEHFTANHILIVSDYGYSIQRLN